MSHSFLVVLALIACSRCLAFGTRSMVGRGVSTSLLPHRVGYLENLSGTMTEESMKDLPARPKLMESSLRQAAEAEAAADMKAYATAKEMMATRFELEAESRKKSSLAAAKAYTERSVKGLMATRFDVEDRVRIAARKMKQSMVARSLLASQLVNMAKTNAMKTKKRNYERQRALLAARFAGEADRNMGDEKYAAIEDLTERVHQLLEDFDLLDGIYSPDGF